MGKRKVNVRRYERTNGTPVRRHPREIEDIQKRQEDLRLTKEIGNSLERLQKKMESEDLADNFFTHPIQYNFNLTGISPEDLAKINEEFPENYLRISFRRLRIKIDGYSYTKKNGKQVDVPEHYKTIDIYPDIIIPKIEEIHGKKRLIEEFTYKGKTYQRIINDKRKIHSIKQPIKEPYDKTMKKKIPHNLMKGFKEIAKDNYEHSIMVDFERKLQLPQRTAIIKGGPSETLKYYDFELYGHTHPHARLPNPSLADLINMKPLEPEFIIAGSSGKIIILNIENETIYDKFCNTKPYKPHAYAIDHKDISNLQQRKKYQNDDQTKKITPSNILESKRGREMFFDFTGIRVYPYKKNTTLELKDDPLFEKRMPNISTENLKKYHKTL